MVSNCLPTDNHDSHSCMECCPVSGITAPSAIWPNMTAGEVTVEGTTIVDLPVGHEVEYFEWE